MLFIIIIIKNFIIFPYGNGGIRLEASLAQPNKTCRTIYYKRTLHTHAQTLI